MSGEGTEGGLLDRFGAGAARETELGGLLSVYLGTEPPTLRRVRIVRIRALNPSAEEQERRRKLLTLLERMDDVRLTPLIACESNAEGDALLVTPDVGGSALPAGPVEAGRVVALGLQLVAVIAAAHEAGIAHLDLTPRHIRVVADADGERLVLIDLGVAELAMPPHSGEDSPSVFAGRAGSAAYRAPEQVRGQSVTRHADFYALGVILYELLTGKPPFVAKTAADTLVAHLVKIAPPPMVGGAEVSGPLVRLILSCLNKMPWHRPGSATEILDALVAMRDAPTHPTTSKVPRPATGAARRAEDGHTPLPTTREVLGVQASGGPAVTRTSARPAPPPPPPVRVPSLPVAAPVAARSRVGEDLATPSPMWGQARPLADLELARARSNPTAPKAAGAGGLWFVLGLLAVGAVGGLLWVQTRESAAPAVVPAVERVAAVAGRGGPVGESEASAAVGLAGPSVEGVKGSAPVAPPVAKDVVRPAPVETAPTRLQVDTLDNASPQGEATKRATGGVARTERSVHADAHESARMPASAPAAGQLSALLVSEPATATVLLDGAVIGRTPMRLQWDAGVAAAVELTLPGYLPAQLQLGDRHAGKMLKLELVPASPGMGPN